MRRWETYGYENSRFTVAYRQPKTAENKRLAEEAGVEPTEDARAPSNGFEARAPHRERYSSERQNARFPHRRKEPARGARLLGKNSNNKFTILENFNNSFT